MIGKMRKNFFNLFLLHECLFCKRISLYIFNFGTLPFAFACDKLGTLKGLANSGTIEVTLCLSKGLGNITSQAPLREESRLPEHWKFCCWGFVSTFCL